MRDPQYLRRVQYRDDSNLNARAELHRRFSTMPGTLPGWQFDQLEVPADAAVLEVGCGPGYFWRVNAERVPDGWSCVLSDLSAGMVAVARDRLGPRYRYAVADAAALPFPDRAFDAVMANHMLYHVPDRARAIRELARVLRPAGTLYAMTNGDAHLRELHQVARAHQPPADQIGRGSHTFRIENGADQLGGAFARVELRRLSGELLVTEAEPVVAYLRSLSDEAADLEPVRREVTAIIERQGVFRIGTDGGLFVARAPIQSGS